MGLDLGSQQSCHLPYETCMKEAMTVGSQITAQMHHIAGTRRAQDHDLASPHGQVASQISRTNSSSASQLISAPSLRRALEGLISWLVLLALGVHRALASSVPQGWECQSADGTPSLGSPSEQLQGPWLWCASEAGSGNQLIDLARCSV